MFFTKTAIILAWIILSVGILMVVSSFAAVSIPDQSYFASTSETIDRGFKFIYFGIVLGVLAEISNHLKPKTTTS